MGQGSSAASASVAELQRLTVTAAAVDADLLGAALSELAPTGWTEHVDGDSCVAEFWVPASDVAAPIRLTRELADRGVAAAVETTVEGDEWRDGLRRHHHPIEVGGVVLVRPPWTEPRDGLLDVVIDPAMAFGTGQHATTKGCLELLIADPGGSLLDVGCGSGVLSIAARRLGYDPVWSVDSDPLAVEATIDNAKVNGVSLRVGLRVAGQDRLVAARTVVANITATYVIPLPDGLPRPLPQRAILSGFRPAEVDRVVAAWAAHGYVLDARVDENDWSAVRLVLR